MIILSLTPCIQPDKIYNFSFKSNFLSPLLTLLSLRHQHLTSQVLSPSISSCFLSYPYNPSTDVSDNNTSSFNLPQWLTTNIKQNPKFLSWPTKTLCDLSPSYFSNLISYHLPLLTPLEPHWPSCSLGNTPTVILPQDLCICYFLCLEYFSH